MGARKLRVVSDGIELDAPEAGLKNTLNDIASDLRQVGQVRRDVRSWALAGAAASSLVTVAASAALFFAFLPGAPPPAIVINPAPVAVVVAAAPKAAPPAAHETKELPELSKMDQAVHRAFSALWASHPKQALVEAETVLASDPNQVDALAAQAFALYDLHRDRAARVAVKKALKLKPAHPLANVLRGMMAQVDHDKASALAHYDRYLKGRPGGALAAELTAVRQNISQ